MASIPVTPEMAAAFERQFGIPYSEIQGRYTNYGEGVGGYEGGRTITNSQYGPYLGDEKLGNYVFQNGQWVPVPEASGSLFGDFIKPIALFGSLMAGGAGLAGMGEGAAAAGAAEAAGGVGSINPALAESFASTYAPSAWTAPAGTAGGLSGAGSNLFGNVGSIGYNPATASVSDIVNAAVASGGNAIPVSALTPELAAAAASGATVSSLSPGMLSQLASTISNATGVPISGSQILSGGLSALGGLLSGNAAQQGARTAADAQIEAARIAAEAAKFKPIGVTTRFGQSNFQKDAQGNVIGAGYTLSPDVKAQQDALMAQSGNMLTQYQNAPAAFAPMGQAGQRAMTLGNQYLATDPAAQAQKYMQEQQALLATGRERDLSQMLSGELNRGTYGLSVGGTSTGMMGANPRLEAMFNAQRQQDLGLAAQATQGGMDYAKFGAGMVGTGGDLTKAMYQGQTAAFDPYKTALGGAQTLEGLGQQSLTMGMDLGRQTSNAAAGGLLAQGMANAAQTMQPANSYSPWGAMLSGAGNAVANYTNPSVNQQYRFDPFTGRPL